MLRFIKIRTYEKNCFPTLGLVISSITFAQDRYEVLKKASNTNWRGYKLFKTESTSHYGTAKLRDGYFMLNKNHQLISGSFNVNLKTIESDDLKKDPKEKKNLENHLKGEDFFDVKNFPIASLQIRKIKASNDQNHPLQVTGDITIKAITKPGIFKGNYLLENGQLSFFSDKITINRRDFKLIYEAQYADVIIKDDIDLKVSIRA
ncbi:YceI family protein [Bacteroidetes bacterium endosymbiont of Geopemphigus sp.]|uniref:YceI family protein n=1 Tax=Bacteroidetes bacterium endosymbiont of Geopemphigus sp. TaxID=2047937 RepID=UPI0018A84258|nr:YceI family protein [Bacteroidetes bacterium endosymbiont of Geopemphigus sp.]